MSKHGCYNRPLITPTSLVQDGWYDQQGQYDNETLQYNRTRFPRMVKIRNPNSKDCQYSVGTPTDPECQGCTRHHLHEHREQE